MTLQLKSTAFNHEGVIPQEYTCDGKDISPPLKWQGIPEATQSLVLSVDDPDAPDPSAPKMTWVHWVVYNIPPDAGHIDAGGRLPAGAKEGVNDWKNVGYGGACPPIGQHRYFHKLYALDTTLNIPAHATKADVERAMRGHILAETKLIGLYQINS